MKDKQEQIVRMANTCNNYYSCALCPYNPEDISRFIGDKWIGGCPNYDRKLVYAMSKGYRKIDEDCVVITKDELKQYKVQAVKEFAERLKEKFDEQKHFYETASISHRDISLTALYTAYKYLDETLKEYKK